MKLKKIASLMLAGIMAVSMLTACGNTVSEKPEDPTEEPDVVVSAATDMLYSELSGSAKARVTAVASEELDEALANAADKYWDYDSTAKFNNLKDISWWNAGKAVKGAMGAEYTDIDDLKCNTTSHEEAVEVYVIDASTSDAFVMELLANKIDHELDWLPKYNHGKGVSKDYVYSYTVSASIVEKTVNFGGVDMGIKYVAVYVAQTAAENA